MRVSHPDRYTGTPSELKHTHYINLEDSRKGSGSLRVIVGGYAGVKDDAPDVKVEIGDYLGESVPVFHIAPNADCHALSVYKLPDGSMRLVIGDDVSMLAGEELDTFILKEHY